MSKSIGMHLLAAAVILAAAAMGTGCGQRVGSDEPAKVTQVMTEPQTQATEAVIETEPETEPPTETETETETEAPRRVTDVDYNSKDGTIKITLPDNTWKVGQDADEMRVFQSGKDAMINIVHANTETAMNSLNVLTTQADLEASLTEQYADPSAFKVLSFIDAPVDDVHVYRYTVQYNSPARMWAYSVTNAIIAPDQAYVVVGSITEDNKKLLEAVQKSVASFRVLKDEKLRSVTGEVITGTIQMASEPVRTDTNSEQELQSLKNYSTTTSLLTSDKVNVRLSPGTDADVLITLDKSSQVTVTGETANWFQVSVNGNTGYIRKDFLSYTNTAQTEAAKAETETEKTSETNPVDPQSAAELGNTTDYTASSMLYATTDVNIRTQPGTDSDVMGSLGTGNAVTVTGETDNWYIVNINGTTGYVSKAYLSADIGAAQAAADAAAAAAANTADNTANAADTAVDNAAADNTNAAADTTNNAAPAADNTQANDTPATDAPAADANTAPADENAGQTNTAPAPASSNISGTVVSTTPDTITIQGDDGQTYNVYYGDASNSTSNGIYDGVYVDINVDGSQTWGDGTLVATTVTG